MKMLPILLTLLGVASTVPALAASIAEEILSFDTHDGLTFDGYITYPSQGTGPFPGVLLITGSGLHDADVTIRGGYGMKGVQKIYKGLAHDFSRQGFTVLRYNKRGASFNHDNDDVDLLLDADHKDLLEDARNALGALVGHPKTAADNLTVVGNSEGELDIATHVSETLALIEKLDRLERPWDAILFPDLGHTLSKSKDYYKEDGGLTILDNPTQNAPKKKVRLEIIRKAREMLELGD